MKITDLYESSREKFGTDLEKEVFDILMMFKSTGADKTDINNVIGELETHGRSVTPEDINDMIEASSNFEIVDGDKIQITDTSGEEAEHNARDASKGDPTVQDEEEFNPAKSKAREAVKKRMKK